MTMETGGVVLVFSAPPLAPLRGFPVTLVDGVGDEAKNGEEKADGGRRGGLPRAGRERQPSEKVKTVYQQIRQRRAIHHVPALSEEAEHKLKQAKL